MYDSALDFNADNSLGHYDILMWGMKYWSSNSSVVEQYRTQTVGSIPPQQSIQEWSFFLNV